MRERGSHLKARYDFFAAAGGQYLVALRAAIA
jgi:hypothetical protein